MSQRHRRRKGQAEIIGAVIATGVMLLAITAMFYSIVRLQFTTSDVYAKRIAFESERSLEKISVIYESNMDPNTGNCIIRNTGGIDIEVVRIWNSNFEYREPYENEKIIHRGDEIKYTLSDAPVAIVTKRGNVFEVKSECEKQAYSKTIIEVIYGSVPGFISSQNIVGTTRLTSNQSCIEYSVKGNVEGEIILIYKNGTKWIYHKCNFTDPSTYGWKEINIPPQSEFVADLDNSTVNEAIVAKNTTKTQDGNVVVELLDIGRSKEQGQSQGISNLTLILTFYNITKISNATDAVTIFYKFVVQTSGGGKPHQIAFSPHISLILTNKTGVIYSAPGSVSVSSSGGDIVVVTGYVVFPRYFYNFVEGNYNVEITLRVDASSGSTGLISIRLEYIAITGAKILWDPLPESSSS